ncbi:transmembrane protein 238 isoform X2 [Tupaia chinensis]|uniref:transmembrane protein 238 isoform X2 n=1 Tax=Tupaia chinensis TaxID=246437 RepID=UPI0003C8DEEA|nr:transmembrane protein 238 isoform X2 [Tupaia chinensis]
MDHPVKAIDVTKKRSGLGRCRHFFWLGVVFDMVGVAVLFIGLFGDLIFYDMLLYLGSIIIFLSLLWWVSWYTGNIELSPGEAAPAPPHVRASTMAHALRQSLSHRFSLTIQSVSNNFVRIHRRRSRRVFQGMATLTPTVSSQNSPVFLQM